VLEWKQLILPTLTRTVSLRTETYHYQYYRVSSITNNFNFLFIFFAFVNLSLYPNSTYVNRNYFTQTRLFVGNNIFCNYWFSFFLFFIQSYLFIRRLKSQTVYYIQVTIAPRSIIAVGRLTFRWNFHYSKW
jgi:hypothetical protein